MLAERPRLARELSRIDSRFKMLQTPAGALMLKTVAVADVSSRIGIPADALISKLEGL